MPKCQTGGRVSETGASQRSKDFARSLHEAGVVAVRLPPAAAGLGGTRGQASSPDGVPRRTQGRR